MRRLRTGKISLKIHREFCARWRRYADPCRAALVKSRLPLIGVNLGTLGYLCELEEKDVFAAVDKLMKDDYMSKSG